VEENNSIDSIQTMAIATRIQKWLHVSEKKSHCNDSKAPYPIPRTPLLLSYTLKGQIKRKMECGGLILTKRLF
jgi:hypothetical protein